MIGGATGGVNNLLFCNVKISHSNFVMHSSAEQMKFMKVSVSLSGGIQTGKDAMPYMRMEVMGASGFQRIHSPI